MQITTNMRQMAAAVVAAFSLGCGGIEQSPNSALGKGDDDAPMQADLMISGSQLVTQPQKCQGVPEAKNEVSDHYQSAGDVPRETDGAWVDLGIAPDLSARVEVVWDSQPLSWSRERGGTPAWSPEEPVPPSCYYYDTAHIAIVVMPGCAGGATKNRVTVRYVLQQCATRYRCPWSFFSDDSSLSHYYASDSGGSLRPFEGGTYARLADHGNIAGQPCDPARWQGVHNLCDLGGYYTDDRVLLQHCGEDGTMTVCGAHPDWFPI